MLGIRSTYGKLDAEQNGAASVGLTAQHQANLTQSRPGTSESSAIKRAFAMVMAVQIQSDSAVLFWTRACAISYIVRSYSLCERVV